MSKGFFSGIIAEVKNLFAESKQVKITEIEADPSELVEVISVDEELAAVLTAAIMAYGYNDFKIKAVKPVVNKRWKELAQTESGKQPFKR
ncbi:OadG family protein [Propionispira raffinosivorans]|uniref:OadG family protein n=1 Tax=Propionispira raffinosivorans TaxID=86959 RepID=UPI000381B4AD|nr:OadG family protein [Propionispira raffinosivorans]